MDNSSLSLTQAVEDVHQQGHIQTEALKEKQKIQNSLQVFLSDLQQKSKAAEQELRWKAREFLVLEGELEQAELQTKVLQDRCASIRKDSAHLQATISEQEENVNRKLEEFKTYRYKMENHRAAVLLALSCTKAHKELEEKKDLVKKLRQETEELREDLQKPDGKTAQLGKRAVEALKEQISEKRTIIFEKKEELQNEGEVHTQFKKDIEIQKRRYEAIVKRLRCQLGRARAARREVSDDIHHMRRQLAEQDSTDTGYKPAV
ncbi:coiled-coil domain-containing protein 122 [Gouania willdenowi]|uniref:Coiled-coil domain-containing protein 122 n=1 Tax=Gouania willdenowi TaxID=441366 RepID=A0A8C5EED1_GOUWI|nr:coiled-coil domain-containing protein 122 [Gouania willdenowi]